MARGDDSKGSDLRRRAESIVRKSAEVLEEADLPSEKMRLLVHELRVHQIELEMQNEELRLAQLALEQARDRFLDLYDYAPVAYFTLDKHGLIMEANLTAVHLLGIEMKSLVKKPFSRLVCKDDQDTYYFHYRLVFDEKTKQTCEIKLVKKNGEQFHAQLESIAAQDDGGDLSQLRIVVTDVTERKRLEEDLKKSHDGLEKRVEERTSELLITNRNLQSEIAERQRAGEALKQSEERFRAVFEGAQDLIFLKDLSLRYTHVNPAVEKVLGLPSSRIIRQTYEDLFGREGSAYVKDADERVLEGKSIEDERTSTVNGIPMTFLNSRIPLRDIEGQVVGILVVSRDITERKRMEFSPLESDPAYSSKAMRSTLSLANVAAQRGSTILLLGESGSGKDYLAKYIHNCSKRSSGPYFSVNCASIAASLAESELFGHEKGSFTGAHARKRGLLELAEGGTLLLNEIAELPLTLQAKLLSFLDTKKFTRVGGEKEISVNVRLLTATNRDLEKEVEAGAFRKDLFYRINVISISVPPLRERREDIPILVQEILSQLSQELQITSFPRIDSAIMERLRKYDWPGNVRELRNVLERAVILSGGKTENLNKLGLPLEAERLDEDWSFKTSFPADQSLNQITQDLKRSLIVEALRRSRGSRKGASRSLGISRYSLKHYMKALAYEGE
jgi:PAS domain S-box-containing protein